MLTHQVLDNQKFIAEFKKEDPKIVPVVFTSKFRDDKNQKTFPLSGVSRKMTNLGNENGYWVIYKSDRYGFNNPDKLWDKDNIDWSIYDVVYVTRLQQERREDIQKADIVIDSIICDQMKEDAIIMHPLPRNQEIHTSVDTDHRCMYFEQMENGVYMRMSILKSILDSYIEEER